MVPGHDFAEYCETIRISMEAWSSLGFFVKQRTRADDQDNNEIWSATVSCWIYFPRFFNIKKQFMFTGEEKHPFDTFFDMCRVFMFSCSTLVTATESDALNCTEYNTITVAKNLAIKSTNPPRKSDRIFQTISQNYLNLQPEVSCR